MIATPLTTLLGLDMPVLGAAMGGIATPELAAAISRAGGGGSVGLFRLPPDAVIECIRQTTQLSTHPFGIGLIPEIHRAEALQEQLHAALAASPPQAFVQFYGLPVPDIAAQVRAAGRKLLIQVGTAADAVRAAILGADALILQGTEAGGHLLGERPLMELLVQVKALQLGLPLIAAGTVASGERLRDVLEAGFAGALCGTLFVCATEAAAHPDYQSRVLEATAEDTMISTAFEIGWPGRRHRVLRTATAQSHMGEIPPDPIATTQVAGRTLPIWRFSSAVPTRSTLGRIDEMALYCGTSCTHVSVLKPAAEILDTLVQALHRSGGEYSTFSYPN